MAPTFARASRRGLAAIMLACASILSAMTPAAMAQTPSTASEVTGASLVPLAALPPSPEHGAPAEFCAHYREPADALSAAGREVEKLGWFVMSKAPLGRYRAVSFASGFEPGTSAICTPRNANIGIFDGTRLIALAYTARKADWHLGRLTSLETGGLLIGEGQGVGGPVAELHQQDEGLRLTAVAASRSFCQGRARVPNVFDKSIAEARKILIAQGWRPMRARRGDPLHDVAADLARHGVIEVNDCSGTGVGYCGYSYDNAAGVLSVVTVGGDPDPRNDDVVSATVACTEK
ncbi:hypothetical protein [Burkholderia gladioli]|uniref:hypothetical protein n=1 Tax=Burkholderia gladioli TaxID=28095 RepID=UPI00163E2A39